MSENTSVAQIDEEKLITDLEYRFQYLCQFIGITERDFELIHGSASFLGPKVDGLVDAVYDRLFSFSCTKKVFFSQREKYDIDDPSHTVTLDTYDLNKPQIGMRKSSLKRFIVRLVTKPYDKGMLAALDSMGRIHKAVNVDLIHMQALIAFVQDAILAEVFTMETDTVDCEAAEGASRDGTARAFCKVLAVLNQFISARYEEVKA